MPTALLVTSVVNTIQIGSLYALMALGITLTFSVIRLPNFAHAEYVTVGAFAALIVSLSGEVNPLVIMTAAFVVGALVALVSHLAVFKPLEGRNVSLYTLILSSFAVGLIIRYILFMIADYFNLFDTRIRIPLQIIYREGALILTNIFAWVAPTSIVLVLLLTLLLNATPLGREMRALANNIGLARVIGIPVERVKNYTWILVGGLAGVAGALWGLQTAVSPLMGWVAILSVFAAAILGGLSSFSGTILGAYVVAFSENTVMLFLNFNFGLDLAYKPAIPFFIIIVVLLIRPQGFTELFNRSRDLQR
ncbi:MAG: branched-chain amino acid ABC transporter permease [Chloroflexota bacterium]|nr:branched-chain amino acid ABC transporter permease [Chloroflexota bacterium]MDE2950887.1 branched-chain amino acid ABC transporter permease [Chloroflexota bacterium]